MGVKKEDLEGLEHDPVNHPTHYASEAKCSGCGESIECIDVVRHMGFDQGNAMKYLWRAGKKDALVQDLRKAIWYIEDMIADIEGKQNPNVHRLSKTGVTIINHPECKFGEPRDLGRAFEFRCETHNFTVIMPIDKAPEHCPMYEREGRSDVG